jgi:hypothetical protein
MASGPVTGSGMLGEHSVSLPVSIIVPTVLQMASDVMNFFTGMTCLYNRYWYAEQERVTLPIAMFHVKDITETWQNETSKKRVIMYEPPSSKPEDRELSDQLRPGVMQTVVDNIVSQPKTYQMEVIIPFQPIGRYIKEGVKTGLAIINGIMDMFEINGAVTDVVRGIFSDAMLAISAIETAADMAGKLPESDGVSYINKNSLEAMAESGKILTMKMWTGYHFKYVVITGMTKKKQPQEDGVFRGTLQLQELPILTMTVPDNMKVSDVNRSWASKAVVPGFVKASLMIQAPLVQALVSTLNVVEASGQKNDLTEMVRDAAGL